MLLEMMLCVHPLGFSTSGTEMEDTTPTSTLTSLTPQPSPLVGSVEFKVTYAQIVSESEQCHRLADLQIWRAGHIVYSVQRYQARPHQFLSMSVNTVATALW